MSPKISLVILCLPIQDAKTKHTICLKILTIMFGLSFSLTFRNANLNIYINICR